MRLASNDVRLVDMISLAQRAASNDVHQRHLICPVILIRFHWNDVHLDMISRIHESGSERCGFAVAWCL